MKHETADEGSTLKKKIRMIVESVFNKQRFDSFIFRALGLINVANYKEMIKMIKEADRSALKTLVGTALIKLATGLIGIWGTINIYFFSYLRNHGTVITPLTNSIVLLCAIIPSSFAVLISTRLTKRFGYKRVIRVCAAVFAFTPYLINFKMNLITLGFCFLLIPITSFAISSIPILNCLWSQFPKDLNKVSGFAVLFFAVGMILWNLIFMTISNPNNQSALIDELKQAYFPSDISDNIFKASNVMMSCCGTLFIIGSFLVSKRQDKEEETVGKLSEQSPPPERQELQKSVQTLTMTNTAIAVKQLKLKESLRDKKFIILFSISFLVPLYLVYMVLYMKLTFMPIINDDHYLAYCSVVLTASAIIGAPFWGSTGDKIGFKKTLFIVVIIDLICKILGLFCQEKWNLIILYFMLGFNDKGILTIIGPGLIEIFGLEMATELIPYKGISLFLAYVTVPLFQIALSSFFTYKVILGLFIMCSGGAVMLAHHFFTKVQYVPFTAHLGQQNCKKLEEDNNMELYMP